MKNTLQDKLSSLQLKLVEELLARIASGEATPADLSVARAILRDNNIQSIPQANPGMMKLVQSLPFESEAESA